MINSDLVQRRLCKLGWTDRDFAKATGITYNRLMEIWDIRGKRLWLKLGDACNASVLNA